MGGFSIRTLVLALGILLVPLALAHEPPADETLALGDEHAAGTVFLKVCGVPSNVPHLIDDCLASGVWENTNGQPHLQVRSGAFEDESGRTVVFTPDARTIP